MELGVAGSGHASKAHLIAEGRVAAQPLRILCFQLLPTFTWTSHRKGDYQHGQPSRRSSNINSLSDKHKRPKARRGMCSEETPARSLM